MRSACALPYTLTAWLSSLTRTRYSGSAPNALPAAPGSGRSSWRIALDATSRTVPRACPNFWYAKAW